MDVSIDIIQTNGHITTDNDGCFDTCIYLHRTI